MINLLIRILSFVICAGLLIGGAILSYTETMANDKFMNDLADIETADWFITEEPSTNVEVPEGDEQLTE